LTALKNKNARDEGYVTLGRAASALDNTGTSTHWH